MLSLTFKLATRSAVSSNVNWLIWSTIPDIFGLVDAASTWEAAAAASPLEHLRKASSLFDAFRLDLKAWTGQVG